MYSVQRPEKGDSRIEAIERHTWKNGSTEMGSAPNTEVVDSLVEEMGVIWAVSDSEPFGQLAVAENLLLLLFGIYFNCAYA
jgi:hypothetical protein